MREKSVMAIVALFICLGFASAASPQNSQASDKARTAPPEGPIGLLIAEAKAADTPDGNQITRNI